MTDSVEPNIFVEDINITSWQLRLFGKQVGNSAIDKFINQILPFVVWKTRIYYQKVDKNFTSQQCPNCQWNLQSNPPRSCQHD